ncbi:MAG: MiaB/RimO family radical SAM methylthiotransferase [Planctomycetota bacterium]
MADVALPQLDTAETSQPVQPDGGGGSAAEPRSDRSTHGALDESAGSGRSVYLETFGCQMNVLDSQLVASRLRGLGYRLIDDWRVADVVLYNTCSVREQAENKARSRLGVVGVHKRESDRDVVLGVIGCMAERDGRAMLRKHPQLDLLCGPGELDRLPELISESLAGREQDGGKRAKAVALRGDTSRRSSTLEAAADDLERLDLSRSFSPTDPEHAQLAGGRSAYVRITRGCNKKCTYCVVPGTRGAEVHRHPDHVVEECRRLVEAGAVEVTLLGQTVNHYHYDLEHAERDAHGWRPQVGATISPNAGNGGPSPTFGPGVVSFAELIARVHDEVSGLRRLRFVTSLPRDFGDDILRAMAERPRVCRYLHLPVQSGSDRVLAKMNRGYRARDYYDLVDRARSILPGAELATDIIVGFPGETDDDFRKTYALVERCRFKNAFIFKYSPRPGTPAYGRMADDVPDAVKRERNQALLELQSRISAEVHAAYVGREVEVLVEGVSPRDGGKGSNDGPAMSAAQAVSAGGDAAAEAEGVVQLVGRTDGDLITHFDGPRSAIGSMRRVRVREAGTLSLSGELV